VGAGLPPSFWGLSNQLLDCPFLPLSFRTFFTLLSTCFFFFFAFAVLVNRPPPNRQVVASTSQPVDAFVPPSKVVSQKGTKILPTKVVEGKVRTSQNSHSAYVNLSSSERLSLPSLYNVSTSTSFTSTTHHVGAYQK
jgi:hypothetical protein